MLVLRVRCVDDGRELLLERRGADEHSIRVVELKKLILQHRCQLNHNVVSTASSNLDLEGCFVLLQGQILADPDVVNLNALRPSDFFVFVADITQSISQSKPSCKVHTGRVDSATFELLRSQLVEMGFSKELAAQALEQSDNNLSDAAALLAEGKLSKNLSRRDPKETTELRTEQSSISSLRNLVNADDLIVLRKAAAIDSFRALLLLKEHFPLHVLNQLNENPVALLKLLTLPASAPCSSTAESEPISEDAIDVDIPIDVDGRSNATIEAVDRLVAMGFARDLVEVMYESCGGDEMLTANALLQTLES